MALLKLTWQPPQIHLYPCVQLTPPSCSPSCACTDAHTAAVAAWGCPLLSLCPACRDLQDKCREAHSILLPAKTTRSRKLKEYHNIHGIPIILSLANNGTRLNCAKKLSTAVFTARFFELTLFHPRPHNGICC